MQWYAVAKVFVVVGKCQIYSFSIIKPLLYIGPSFKDVSSISSTNIVSLFNFKVIASFSNDLSQMT